MKTLIKNIRKRLRSRFNKRTHEDVLLELQEQRDNSDLFDEAILSLTNNILYDKKITFTHIAFHTPSMVKKGYDIWFTSERQYIYVPTNVFSGVCQTWIADLEDITPEADAKKSTYRSYKVIGNRIRLWE